MRRDDQIIDDVVRALGAQDNTALAAMRREAVALAAMRREAVALPAPVRAQMRARWAAVTNAAWRRWRDAELDAAMRRWIEEVA